MTGAQNAPASPIGWDAPRTAWHYEDFCRRHERYREANAALVAHAALGPGQRVMDVAAGTGRTAEMVLPLLGGCGSILCLEPAAAKRAAGQTRLSGPRIHWTAAWPEDGERFSRILCGAAI